MPASVVRSVAVAKGRRRTVWVGSRLVDVTLGVLFIAGIAKIIDVPEFARALLTWKYIPRGLVMPLAYGVPLSELGLGLLWFLRLGRRTAVLGAGMLLIVFTATYLYHTLDPGLPPDCGCLGRIIQYEAQQSAIGGLVLRNGGLLALLVSGALVGQVFGPGDRRQVPALAGGAL